MKLVFGVGINDSTTPVNFKDCEGNYVRCNFYSVWKSMLSRAYSDNYKSRKPSYDGVTVCDNWHSFSNFRQWMQDEKFENRELDKDLLSIGNKEYTPDKCVFVPNAINMLFNDNISMKGQFPTGISYAKDRKKHYHAYLTMYGKRINLGHFYTQAEAEIVRLKYKKKYAIQLCDEVLDNDEYDSVIKNAIYNRLFTYDKRIKELKCEPRE